MTNVSRRDFLKRLAELAGGAVTAVVAVAVIPEKSAASDTMFQYKGHNPLNEKYYTHHFVEWYSPFRPEVETGKVNYETHPI